MKKIVFMGTPQIAADVLQALLDAQANVVLAVTQPDRKAGRKGKMKACEVKELALSAGIPVFSPQKIREDYSMIEEIQPDLIITCAYGQIVPKGLLELPKYGCVNLHGSMLPEYRGAAPIQRAIMDGKSSTAMALMQMEEGMDTGGVADAVTIDIDPDMTSEQLFSLMGQKAGELIVKDLPALLEGALEFVPQDHDKATYAAKLTAQEEHLDLNWPMEKLYNHLRGLMRQPGGYVLVGGKKLKVLQAKKTDEYTQPGEFWQRNKKELLLSGPDGSLVLEEVQMEGKPAMKIRDFLNGQGKGLIGKKADE